MESEVTLNIGLVPFATSGLAGFDLGFPTRNKSKNVGDGAFLELLGEGGKSAGDGLECAGGRK